MDTVLRASEWLPCSIALCHRFADRQQDVVHKSGFDGDACQPIMHRLPHDRELRGHGRQHGSEAARPDVAGTQREHHDVVAVTVGWAHPFQQLVADGLDRAGRHSPRPRPSDGRIHRRASRRAARSVRRYRAGSNCPGAGPPVRRRRAESVSAMASGGRRPDSRKTGGPSGVDQQRIRMPRADIADAPAVRFRVDQRVGHRRAARAGNGSRIRVQRAPERPPVRPRSARWRPPPRAACSSQSRRAGRVRRRHRRISRSGPVGPAASPNTSHRRPASLRPPVGIPRPPPRRSTCDPGRVDAPGSRPRCDAPAP